MGSLFDGSGGFPLGAWMNEITPIWASEVEPFPIRVTTKRFPQMRHYGDISSMDGVAIEPVDIITFGSPCTDLSVAGKREGLDGKASSLFYQAIRVIKEMRVATSGRYPRFIVWENVPGAYSSAGGRDFQQVLTEIAKIKDETAVVPMPEKRTKGLSGKWMPAGEIVGDGFSIAWRTIDAQYWGVAQRRRRCYLVADFADECAGKILFEFEGVSGYTPQGFGAGQRTAGYVEGSAGDTGNTIVNGQKNPDGYGHTPCDVQSAGFCTVQSAKSRSIGFEEEQSPTLRAGVVPGIVVSSELGVAPCLDSDQMAAAMFENHSQSTRYKGPLDVAQTVSATYGMGGNNQPFVVETLHCSNEVAVCTYGISSYQSNAMLSDNPKSGIYEADTSRTLDQTGGNPACNQGGMAVVSYAVTADNFPKINRERTATLMARDHKGSQIVNEAPCRVRRLTPQECALLQGFPMDWCADLETSEPTDADVAWWTEVFETHRKIIGKAKRPKSRNQIVKWLKDPHTNSAEYKMWGNGVALPCICFVMAGIVWADTQL